MDTDLISTLSGFYVLTRDGELGVYDEHKQFHKDESLTAALREHVASLLDWYRAGGEGKHARIGFIYPTREGQPWKTATFFFEDQTIRHLYPVGSLNAPLTTFQKKHQRNSYFRALENLIGARVKDSSGMMFCPVLFDAGGTLNQYAHLLGQGSHEDIHTPVVEVLNLVAHLATTQRDIPALQTIEARIRNILIERERSRAAFTLLDDVRYENAQGRGKGWDDVNVREQRNVTISAEDLDRLPPGQRHEGVEQWLEIPIRPVNTADLCRFVHFRDLNPVCLNVLATRSLVYSAPSGTALLEQGMNDHWNMYLLEGTLLLSTDDGKTITVDGGSSKAETPVAFLKPRKYKVISLTKVSFLWIHDSLLHAIREARGKPSSPLHKTG